MDSPVGQHLLDCNKEVGGNAELKSEVIDQTANTQKLLTLVAFAYLEGEADTRDEFNTRDELRTGKLTLKL